MTPIHTCSRCGAMLPGTLLGGLCPHCVAVTALGGDPANEGTESIGGYEILSELGRGGMGVVYLARQRALDRLVALKTLVSGPQAGALAEERFLREAREAARLHHPHIVSIHEVGRHNGVSFYSMDLIEGEDLAVHVTRQRPDPRAAAMLLVKAARAVQHAHDAGLLHRDIKPANLLIDAAGEPHLTDFGLVVAVDGSDGLTRTGEIIGSPGYMAPEQLRGVATIASDVYALGAILYFLLTARPPFVAAQLPELLSAIAAGDPLPPRRLDPSLPRDLETITLRALAREPAGRYASAQALADDLDRWLEGRAITARPVGVMERAWSWARRNRSLALVAAALATTVMAGTTGVIWQWIRAERAATSTALHLYSADLKVASDALQTGDLGLARRTLESCPLPLRDTAWGLLWPLAAGESEAVLGNVRWTVTHLTVSPDGRFAVSAAQHDQARLWDLTAARPADELPVETLSWWAAFSPDGRALFIADRTIKQWDLAQRAVVREFPGQSGALSPDGRVLYTCAGHRFVFEGEPGKVAAWNVRDGAQLWEAPVQARCIALSPDGTRLAISDAENWVALHDAQTGRALSAPWPSRERIWHLTFSPDGTRLVASGWSKAVRVWTMLDQLPTNGGATPAFAASEEPHAAPETSKVADRQASPLQAAAQLLEHPLITWQTAFSPDGATLAVACSDRQVHLWDVRTWQRKRTLRGHYNEVWSVAWQPDGRLLSAGRDPRLLRWQTNQEPVEKNWVRHDDDTYRVVWLPDARIATVHRRPGGEHATVITSVRQPGGEVELPKETPLAYDSRTERLWLWSDHGELRARRIAELNDVIRVPWKLESGETFLDYPYVVPAAGVGWAALKDGALAVHRLDDGQRVARHDNLPVRRPWAAAMSPDGTRFVWGGLSTELFSLDLTTGVRASLDGHYYEVATVAFTADGKSFLTGGGDGLLMGWDTATGERRWQLGTHATSVSQIIVTPDGRVALSQEQGVGIHVWHLANLREVAFIEVKDESTDQWFGLSPDGRWLAIRKNDGELRVFPVGSPTGEGR